ncbi:MAG: ribulose-phosphate 3-epimerase [Deltaproteobacteria bacterium]|jgi:ribulose-phosphate 3-epimerase|nr:ribulose-phosphate 3-epimerase [Deltaproteobacteria bacterium]
MTIIAPSILSADYGRLAQEIEAIEAAGADWLHIDIMDGHFVPNLTFGPWVVTMAKKLTRLPLDAHLMVADPVTYGPIFTRAGADYVTIHVETTPHLHLALDAIRQAGARPGVALNPLTPLTFLEPCLDFVDLVVLMGVNPGWAGQTFIPATLTRITQVAQLLAARKSAQPIHLEVDGGVSDQTAPLLNKAGATVLVSGSYIFQSPDYGRAIAGLRHAMA